MHMVKNQRMVPIAKKSLHIHDEAAQSQAAQARTPNMAQGGAQRPTNLKDLCNQSNSSKHLKVTQNKRVLAKKGPAGAQSGQHPNKPN